MLWYTGAVIKYMSNKIRREGESVWIAGLKIIYHITSFVQRNKQKQIEKADTTCAAVHISVKENDCEDGDVCKSLYWLKLYHYFQKMTN